MQKRCNQIIAEKSNGKMCRPTQLEELYVLVSEPGTYYLTHLSPTDGKGCTLVQESETELCEKLTIIDTVPSVLMTGKFNNAIRSLEELLDIHCSGQSVFFTTTSFPFDMFLWNYNTINSPDSFTGPTGKQLDGCVSKWPIANFKNIPNVHFPDIPHTVVDELSSDQHYAYRICMAVTVGLVDEDLHFLKVGPIVHSL